jgi:hypothetical protein
MTHVADRETEPQILGNHSQQASEQCKQDSF